jgi:hypothetical protein
MPKIFIQIKIFQGIFRFFKQGHTYFFALSKKFKISSYKKHTSSDAFLIAYLTKNDYTIIKAIVLRLRLKNKA